MVDFHKAIIFMLLVRSWHFNGGFLLHRTSAISRMITYSDLSRLKFLNYKQIWCFKYKKSVIKLCKYHMRWPAWMNAYTNWIIVKTWQLNMEDIIIYLNISEKKYIGLKIAWWSGGMVNKTQYETNSWTFSFYEPIYFVSIHLTIIRSTATWVVNVCTRMCVL